MSFIVSCGQVMVVQDCTEGCVAPDYGNTEEWLGLQVQGIVCVSELVVLVLV